MGFVVTIGHLVLGRYDWTAGLGGYLGGFAGMALNRRQFDRRHGRLLARVDFEDAVRTGRPPPGVHLPTWSGVVAHELRTRRRAGWVAVAVFGSALALLGWLVLTVDRPGGNGGALFALGTAVVVALVLTWRRRVRRLERLADQLRRP